MRQPRDGSIYAVVADALLEGAYDNQDPLASDATRQWYRNRWRLLRHPAYVPMADCPAVPIRETGQRFRHAEPLRPAGTPPMFGPHKIRRFRIAPVVPFGAGLNRFQRDADIRCVRPPGWNWEPVDMTPRHAVKPAIPEGSIRKPAPIRQRRRSVWFQDYWLGYARLPRTTKRGKAKPPNDAWKLGRFHADMEPGHIPRYVAPQWGKVWRILRRRFPDVNSANWARYARLEQRLIGYYCPDWRFWATAPDVARDREIMLADEQADAQRDV